MIIIRNEKNNIVFGNTFSITCSGTVALLKSLNKIKYNITCQLNGTVFTLIALSYPSRLQIANNKFKPKQFKLTILFDTCNTG